jgi:hypothetical protein
MNFLNKVKLNEVTAMLEQYTFLVMGTPKSGKTSLYRDFVLSHYGTPSAGLLIPFEKGYSAISNINVLPFTILNETEIDGDKREGWKVFVEIIDDLVSPENKDIKMVCIDTIDEFLEVASKHICKISAQETGKPCRSLNAAFGGFNRGFERLASTVKEQLERLKNAGIGIFFIGHTKVKNLKTKVDETEYQILGSNLSENMYSIIANGVDLIAMITNEPVIVKGEITGYDRKIRFRSDGFYVAGSRFKDMPETIEYNSEKFLQAIQTGIEKASGKTIAELKAQEAKELSAFEARREAIQLDKNELQAYFLNVRNAVQRLTSTGTASKTSLSDFGDYMESEGLTFKELGDMKKEHLDKICQIFRLTSKDMKSQPVEE